MTTPPGLHGILPDMAFVASGGRARAPRPPRPPTAADLHDAALRHLARYATTSAGLLRVLERRIDRWARADAPPEADAIKQAKAAARLEVARLVQDGLIDDAAFAASRTRSLGKTGHSRRAIAAHLAARGIGAGQAAPADADESELAAAVMFTRRRRIGAFAVGEVDARKALGMLARAGFTQEVAGRALAMPPDEAEALMLALKRA